MSALLGCPWWVLLAAGVGVLAAAAVIVELFFDFGDRPARVTATELPPVDSERFLRGIAGSVNAPLERGGSARLLNNGVEIFPALLDAIGRAERTVNFMVYIWEPGRASDRVLDALVERQRAGVQVRLMVDAVGALRAPVTRLRELREAGGRVVRFHPIRFGWLLALHRRNHRRAIVIDGRVAFTGGAAVGDRWLGDAQDEEHWRDLMVEVRGSPAANLQSAFTQLWADVTGEILVGDDFYPPHPRKEAGGAALWHVNVVSSPAEASAPLRTFFWLTLACARERLYLAHAYFAPEADTRRVLAERARAGVDVRLLLPGPRTDMPMVRRAGQALYRELLEAGVRIYEYQPTMLHAKTVVVDGMWSVVGSANMDIRSREVNQESVIGILDAGFGRELEETFVADLRDAREITLEGWKRRSLLQRVEERFWLLFAEQL